MNDKISGIYCILNENNRKCYVGSAVDIKQRWREHKSRLGLNNHHSVYLQRAWNKEPEAFSFNVLEYVPSKEDLLELEQFWMDWFKTADGKSGYNMCSVAGSQLGRRHSEETKLKMSLARTGLTRNGAAKKAISLGKLGEKNPAAKLTVEDVVKIRALYKVGHTQRSLAKTYDVTYQHISSIILGKTWGHI